jgi:hypothetical protein
MNLSKKFSNIFEWTFEKKEFDVYNCFVSIVRLFFFKKLREFLKLMKKVSIINAKNYKSFEKSEKN